MTTKAEILAATAAYFKEHHAPAKFIAGESYIPASGKKFDYKEGMALVNAALDFWLTEGEEAHEFEKLFAAYLGVRHSILCNSGSSALLHLISSIIFIIPQK